MQTQTIALLGATQHTDNYGVRVLLTASLEAIAASHPKAEILAIDYDQRGSSWCEIVHGQRRLIPLINLRFSWKIFLHNNVFTLVAIAWLSKLLPRFLNDWLRSHFNTLLAISRIDCCYAIAGGDSFSDIYGLRRFTYVALPQLLVSLLGRPLVQLPQTYGPFEGRCAKLIARTILQRSDTILSRDRPGCSVVASLLRGKPKVTHVSPDLGFFMQPQTPPSATLELLRVAKSQRLLVGLNVSSLLYMGGYSGHNMFRLRDPFPVLIEQLALRLLSDEQVSLILVPHVCGGPSSQEDETRLCKRLAEKLRLAHSSHLYTLPELLTHQETKGAIGWCDLFIGSRMHACVAAVSQAVPTICLAYSQKFAGVMDVYNGPSVVIDLRDSDTSRTMQTVAQVLAAVRDGRFQGRVPVHPNPMLPYVNPIDAGSERLHSTVQS